MAVSLADSMFLSISPTDARPKVFFFLALSFAPFVFVARFVGPVVERFGGGQRAVLFGVCLMRAVLMVAVDSAIRSVLLFPVAFGALVLSKTYSISKSATVPLLVTGDSRLVEANSRLAKIAGIVGFAAGVPAFLLQMIDPSLALYAGALLFLLAAVQAWHLPSKRAEPAADPELEFRELHSVSVVHAANTMRFLRAAVGFMFFHLAFGNLSILAANWAAPAVRARMSTQSMLTLSIALVAAGGLVAGFSGVFITGILLTAVVNASAAIGRVAFEATVQSGAPDADKVGAFARFETHNQLAWVAGGLVPVVLRLDGPSGSWCIGVVGVLGVLVLLRDRRLTAPRAGRARARERRSR
jgi:hypothetical protein